MAEDQIGNKDYMSHEHDIVLVPLSGDLCVRTAPALKATLERLVQQGSRRIILNMADVSFVDSAGMAVLFSTIRRMREQEGLLSLVNVTPDVLRALKIARMVDYVPVSAAGSKREVTELDPAVQPLWRTSLPVDADDLHATRVRIEQLAGQLSFSHDAVFDLTLAAGEALGNAADHTCGEGILATVSGYPDRMVIEVSDCGEGFDIQKAEAHVPQEDEERGRGIKLMQLLVDSVSIQERRFGCGTVVRLVKLV